VVRIHPSPQSFELITQSMTGSKLSIGYGVMVHSRTE